MVKIAYIESEKRSILIDDIYAPCNKSYLLDCYRELEEKINCLVQEHDLEISKTHFTYETHLRTVKGSFAYQFTLSVAVIVTYAI